MLIRGEGGGWYGSLQVRRGFFCLLLIINFIIILMCVCVWGICRGILTGGGSLLEF